ncbi:tRNA-specific adenosine deaminase [Megamonas hypermegale]|uniref:nucleoside deaminase n=1 Tax=Megamonas hypermegale TaxID=158847 RepID=UPI000B38A279|nr:nucleoside deaminase [Megamonas hypermegale]OUO40074.1 tRNA-specific adenosine deaminase [Megamonas hypermegale]
MYNQEFMLKATSEADNNLQTNEGGPFGAVVVKDDKIVGKGHNRVLINHDPTCHAEIEAIRDACKNLNTHDLTGCTLYTSCYPCPMCLSAIIWANIKKVYYGNTAKDAADIGFRDDFIYKFIEGKCSDASVLDLVPQDHDMTIKTFEAFAQKQDKTIY